MPHLNDLTIVTMVKSFKIPYGVIETGEDGLMVSLSEKPELTYQVNTGVYILNPNCINEIPEGEFFHITQLMGAVVEKHCIDAIVTAATDKPLVMMARVAEKYGFPFFSVDTARWSTDKYQMKQRFMEGGVPCAKGRLVKSLEETTDFVFPVIVKPRDNSGSRGVKLCRTIEELESSMAEALEYSRLDSVLVEEFIEGQEYSIEGLHYNGKSEVIQFTEKKTTEFPYNVELGHKQPANDLRSTYGMFVPEEYRTYTLNFGDPIFERIFREEKGFDIVANFSAHKHVRSEKDKYSVQALIENNDIKAKKLLDLMLEFPPKHFFCVSTDKAANPVNIMGASKRVMEDMIMAYADIQFNDFTFIRTEDIYNSIRRGAASLEEAFQEYVRAQGQEPIIPFQSFIDANKQKLSSFFTNKIVDTEIGDEFLLHAKFLRKIEFHHSDYVHPYRSALSAGCARACDQRPDAGVPPRQAPCRLRHQSEQTPARQRIRRPAAGGDRPHGSGRPGFQQRRPDPQPQPLLHAVQG